MAYDEGPVSDAVIRHKGGLTVQMLRQMRDNMLAMFAGLSGAPKIRRINDVLFTSSGSAGIAFTSLGDFSGIEFMVFANNDNGSNQPLNFQYSTDNGATWSTALTLSTMFASNGAAHGSGYFDFASGEVGFAGADEGGDAEGATATMAGASLSIDAVKFSTGSTGAVSAHIRPCGATI